jgi:hypothetical protein
VNGRQNLAGSRPPKANERATATCYRAAISRAGGSLDVCADGELLVANTGAEPRPTPMIASGRSASHGRSGQQGEVLKPIGDGERHPQTLRTENAPCFSSNSSTFMSNCFSVVTTINSKLAGGSSDKARALAPRWSSHGAGPFRQSGVTWPTERNPSGSSSVLKTGQ